MHLELVHFLLRGLEGKVTDFDLCGKGPTLVVTSVISQRATAGDEVFLEGICNDSLFGALARRGPL